jgi:hypothetical protein
MTWWRVEIDLGGFPARLVPGPDEPRPRHLRGAVVHAPMVETPSGDAIAAPLFAEGECTWATTIEADNAWYATQLFLEQLPEEMLRGATKLSITTEALR